MSSSPPPPAYNDNKWEDDHQSSIQPGSDNPLNRQTINLEKLRQICGRLEIADFFALKLRQLEGFEIVLILDDSGSMNTPVTSGGVLSRGSNHDAFGKLPTRWDELKQTILIITEIASLLDSDGIDCYFLNRGVLRNVTSEQQVAEAFSTPAAGLTPISNTLRTVLREKANVMSEKKLLILIATDGEPTNDSGQVDIKTLRYIMQHERNAKRCYVSFLACTDDDSTVEYLNKWDEELEHVDVCDDYKSEKAEILKAQGQGFRFSFADYVCKILLGTIDNEMDLLDQRKVGSGSGASGGSGQKSQSNSGCCNIQ